VTDVTFGGFSTSMVAGRDEEVGFKMASRIATRRIVWPRPTEVLGEQGEGPGPLARPRGS
jgi:hypothetical protein